MFSLRPRRIEVCLIALLASCSSSDIRLAPRHDAPPVDQLSIAGNACGPAALLASFRAGNDSWQRAETALPGASDRQQLGQWIRRYGMRPSATLKGRMRWTRDGVNVEDLTAAANEITRPLFLPQLGHDDLFRRRGESGPALLNRTRKCLDKSLANGIPPLLSLRRFALRKGTWTPVQGHFVTVVAVPRRLARGESSITIRYLDPLGGKTCEGILRVPRFPLLSATEEDAICLEAVVPESQFGRNQVPRGETSAVVPAAIIGRW